MPYKADVVLWDECPRGECGRTRRVPYKAKVVLRGESDLMGRVSFEMNVVLRDEWGIVDCEKHDVESSWKTNP